MTSRDVGDAANSSPKKSRGRGQSSAQGAKPATLSDQLRDLSQWTTSTSRGCSIMTMRDFMSQQDFAAVLEAIDDNRIIARRIAELLRSSDFRISDDTVQRCRKRRQLGDCVCQ